MSTLIIEIPLNKLVQSVANVRKTAPMLGVEELADNIAAHGGRLIQSLAVRPIRTGDGEETGMFSVPAGGRRLAALKLLAKRRVIAKTAPIPCIVRDEDELEISLSENVMREALHPADQFDAFKALADEGRSAKEIGARFGVTAQVVRQRLRLAAVSPMLMQKYRDDELTLDQLIAFAVTEDHARQEQVYAMLASNLQPYLIRRMLTETHVPARDRRALFVGAEAYIAAGGAISRDLFAEDGGGWFGDPALLDCLVLAKLETVAAEARVRDGWKWVEAQIEYPHAHGLRRVYPREREMTADEARDLDALTAKRDALVAEYEAADEISEDVSDELDALASEIEALSARAFVFDPGDVARGGAFVVLGHDGKARIECGFIRPEDIPPPNSTATHEPPPSETTEDASTSPSVASPSLPAIPEALVRDLSAHRTMALRFVLGGSPEVALTAVVHALVLRSFGQAGGQTCLDLTARSAGLGPYAPGIEDSVPGRELAARHTSWAVRLPRDAHELWRFLTALDTSERLALLAHCAALSVFAVSGGSPSGEGEWSPVDTLCRALALDMSAFWKPTAASYFSRITKAQIIRAVEEAVSDEAGRRIEGMNKAAMADAAKILVAELPWLPRCMRTSAE